MNPGTAQEFLKDRVSRETCERLVIFHDLLLKWQTTINLVASATLSDIWTRHFLDSAQVFDLATNGPQTWLDLGSGGGFPGLVVAAMGAEQKIPIQVTLVESDVRKCGFMREAARAMGISVRILPRRIKDIPPQKPDVISARALASLPALIRYSEPHIGEKTLMLFPKGRRWREELECLPVHWQRRSTPLPSQTDPNAAILKIDTIPAKGHA